MENKNSYKEIASIKPSYKDIPDWEFYPSGLLHEYRQAVDEGLDVAEYKALFDDVAALPKNEIKKELGDVLHKIIANAGQAEGYKYVEPSGLEEIKALRTEHKLNIPTELKVSEEKIHGAWLGRICGCMLGKTVEGIHSDELVPFLKETGNYPMQRYIRKTDINDEICKKYSYPFAERAYADEIDGMPMDDDTNYVVLAQLIFEKYGKNFTPYDVSRAWLEYQPKDAYCTAERVAYCGFVNGFLPPESAVNKNPYREWIGAQIRGDYWGYINPGNPELAAEMAWRDASISHVKNGIYGEMFAAAMLAAAAVTNDIEEIILTGLSQIPHTSRLYEDIMTIMEFNRSGKPKEEAFEYIHNKYDEYTEYGWCHTNSNAMIVAAALLYGGGDYGKSICMAVETAFDTDCNGATVGSVLGMANGIEGIDTEWTTPIKDTLHTSIFGVGTVKISDMVNKTMEHIKKAAE